MSEQQATMVGLTVEGRPLESEAFAEAAGGCSSCASTAVLPDPRDLADPEALTAPTVAGAAGPSPVDVREGSWITRKARVLGDIHFPKPEARGVPFEFVVEPSAKCNLLCPMCPREVEGYLAPEDDHDMPMDVWCRCLDAIKEVATFVWFTGRGEPLLNKNFPQMVRDCRALGIRTGASSNGTIMTEKWRDAIIDSGLDYLIISFDGADKETYEKLRLGAKFDRVVSDVRKLAERKVERKAKSPFLVLQMIEMKPNLGQQKAFRKMWDIPGVNAVRLKDEQLQHDDSLTFEGQRQRTGKKPCMNLWRGVPMIQWDGTMLPCCFGPAHKHFGKLSDAGVRDLWNSKHMKDLRQAHLDGKGLAADYCKNCNAIEPGKIMNSAQTLLPILWQKKQIQHVENLNRIVKFL